MEISKIDCFVLPTFYGEGVPRSLLEAASMGKPIITTNHPGCKDVVKHNYNGFLVKPRSLEQLTSYMDKFINLPPFLIELPSLPIIFNKPLEINPKSFVLK